LRKPRSVVTMSGCVRSWRSWYPRSLRYLPWSFQPLTSLPIEWLCSWLSKHRRGGMRWPWKTSESSFWVLAGYSEMCVLPVILDWLSPAVQSCAAQSASGHVSVWLTKACE
jgi:hypothetical protein